VIGVTYDANGNVIQEMNGTRLVYDAFNRVRKVTFLAECTYGYGPDNEQVETNCTDTGGPYTVLYGADGRRMGGYSSAVDRTGRLYFSGGVHTVYFAGRPIDVSGRMFLALDRLGAAAENRADEDRILPLRRRTAGQHHRRVEFRNILSAPRYRTRLCRQSLLLAPPGPFHEPGPKYAGRSRESSILESI
jgi:hypothetical protein